MKAFKFALATILLLGAVGATLVVNPILAQTPNPGPEAKPNEVVVFALKNASASEVARVLGEIFNGPRQGDGSRRNTISVAVDARVNSVVVFAPPARLDEIKALTP